MLYNACGKDTGTLVSFVFRNSNDCNLAVISSDHLCFVVRIIVVLQLFRQVICIL